MKKIRLGVIIACTTILLAACANENQPINETTLESSQESTTATSQDSTSEKPSENPSVTPEQQILDAFTTLIEDSPSELYEIASFLNDNIKSLSPENVDAMLTLYENAQRERLTFYEDKFYTQERQTMLLKYSLHEIQNIQVDEEELKVLLKELMPIGFKMEEAEGAIFPVVDYSFYMNYTDYATEEILDFFTLMTRESDQPSQKDGGLYITWEEVLDRAVNYERYIEKYPSAHYLERIKMYFEGYKEIALNGSINTPLYDYDNQVMAEKAMEAYQAFLSASKPSEFTTLIDSYMALLEKNEYIKTQEIEAFIQTNK